MANKKIIKATIEGKDYEISCSETEKILSFKDNTGGKLLFIKGEDGLGIFINDIYKYDKNMIKKYPNLNGINSYFLVPEQVNMFITWYFLDIFNKKEEKK